MKLPVLLTAVVLGMSGPLPAQPQTSAPPANARSGSGGSGGGPVPGAAAAAGSKAGPVKDPNMNADGSVTLAAGTLKEVFAEIERRVGYWPSAAEGSKAVRPNILLGAEARDLVVPGELRLWGVTPLQAYALSAAAVGCTLEPVFAPVEDANSAGKPQLVIGYRVVLGGGSERRNNVGPRGLTERERRLSMPVENTSLVSPRAMPPSASISGIGIVLSQENGHAVVGQVLAGSPAAKSPVITPGQRILSVQEPGKPEVAVSGLELQQLAEVLRGAPGTSVNVTFGTETEQGLKKQSALLVREKLPLSLPLASAPPLSDPLATVSPGGAAGMPSSLVSYQLVTNGTIALAGRALPERASGAYGGGSGAMGAGNAHRQVRVYALGTVLGNGPDTDRQKHCERLIQSTLHQAGLAGSPTPEFSFHAPARVLVVNATVAQQELIEQVINALKENEAQPKPPAKP